MAVKIQSKIVNYKVVTAELETVVEPGVEKKPEVIHMTEEVKRPEGLESLEGSTYKIRTPLDEHALYVTINDIVLNQGTEHEARRPFEIFINSKNMDHFQWIVALTRVMSSVFRKGGDVTFLSEELQAVFDPRGGYFRSGGKFMPSLVAEIGAVIERHLIKLGMMQSDELTPEEQELIQMKHQQIALAATPVVVGAEDSDNNYPESATLCYKCNTKAMILMDGCETCLSCGNSKCG